jgi:adenine-specific DNA-methyltransferase
MSYCLQKAYIENNEEPLFKKIIQTLPQQSMGYKLFASPLDTVVDYLNQIPDVKGFIYNNYTPEGTKELEQPRMYFSNENGLRIDAIRQQIETWNKEELLSDTEYYILLTCLIETVSFYANVAGVYAAFHKKWDPRAIKRLELRTIKIHNNKKINKVYNSNSLDLLEFIDTDILYLDPPYNERQYLPNYHLVETIAKYDNPKIKGVTGMREYENKKSTFCNAKTALRDLETIIKTAKYKYLIMSYNSEGIMPQEEIINMMSKYGTVKLEQFQYARFKSNNNGLSKTKKHIYEQLYILRK